MKKMRYLAAVLGLYLFFFVNFSFFDSLGFLNKALTIFGFKSITQQTSFHKVTGSDDPIPDPPDPVPPPPD